MATKQPTPSPQVPPELSWEMLRTMMASPTGRSDAWRQAGQWALTVLEERLGGDWPARVQRKSPDGGAPELARAAGYVVAYAQVLEWALRLELLDGCDGYAKARKAIANDPRPELLAHSRVQLEVAALALKSGSKPTLEPLWPHGRPADVAFDVGDRRLVVETRVILTGEDWRERELETDLIFEAIHRIETRHSVRCEGQLTEFLNDDEVHDFLSALETSARLVAVGLEPLPLIQRGVAITVVPRTQSEPRPLSGPQIRSNSWSRIAPRITEKAEAAIASGASWLRLDAHDGIWQFTEWSIMPLTEKVRVLADAVRPLLPGLEGIVISCGALLAQGTFADEHVTAGPGLIAIRRNLPFVRVREALIISVDDSGISPAQTWSDLYADEDHWLDWALDQAGLPPLEEILVD
jgi:hypothetical protein